MKKPLFNKVCIVGVGLIGGSLGLAIKKRRLAKFVTGVVRRKESAIAAVSTGAVDMATLDLKEGVANAELVILAGPIDTIIQQLKIIRSHLSRSAIVIDVGSTKELIEKTAIKNRYKTWFTFESKGPRFIGCHPLAGSEKTGVINSNRDMFKNAICFITEKNKKVESLWKEVGCKVHSISAASHDSFAAHVSHMPHLLAFSMLFGWEAKYPLTNPSMREIVRLSKSDPELWAQVFCSNSRFMRNEIDFLTKNLRKWRKALSKKNQILKLIKFSQDLHKVNG